MNLSAIEKIYPFQPERIPVRDNLDMAYIETGSNHASTVLMVHGNPTWSFYFRNLMQDLTGFHCLAIDHIGCGNSSRTSAELKLVDRIDHLEQFVIKKDLRNIHLIAHDWGGAIGSGVLVRQPERFKSVTYMNTAAFNSRDIPRRIALCKVPVLGKVINYHLNGFCLAATRMASTKPLDRETKRGYLWPYRRMRTRKAVHDFVSDIPLTPAHPTYQTLYKIERGLRELSLPVLLLWGGRDFCFDLSFMQKFQEIFPHAKSHIFREAGHYVLEDSYSDCLKELRDFYQDFKLS